jgi:hypothetical protein
VDPDPDPDEDPKILMKIIFYNMINIFPNQEKANV